MEFVRGLIVRSAAGRDKGGFFTVLEVRAPYAVICDGKRRTLEHPKLKKFIHLDATKSVLPNSSMGTNREIRNALRPFGQTS